MQINKTILDLNTVYCSYNHAQTIELLEVLNTSKKKLKILSREISEHSDGFSFQINKKIEEQLVYLDMNIKTVENALLCHESKITEKHNFNGVLLTINLN